MWLVLSEEKASLEEMAINATQIAAGIHALSRTRLRLFNMIIGSLACDDDIVNMALAQSCIGDADEAGIFL